MALDQPLKTKISKKQQIYQIFMLLCQYISIIFFHGFPWYYSHINIEVYLPQCGGYHTIIYINK